MAAVDSIPRVLLPQPPWSSHQLLPPARVRLGEVPVYIDRYLREDSVHVLWGCVFAGSFSAVLAQIERERRRRDAVAAFAPEQLEAW